MDMTTVFRQIGRKVPYIRMVYRIIALNCDVTAIESGVYVSYKRSLWLDVSKL